MSIKLILSAFAVIIAGLNSVKAQSSARADSIAMYCVDITHNPPLFIIVTSEREIPIPNGAINEIKPDWIASLKILKDSVEIAKYGEKGKNGVILLSLKEEKLQEVLRALKLKE
ncbi:hypothetical protein GZH53_01575 [Flavihumibacter sp. R14]|nr:hypothetical protein [Flavihumibacter soli]